MRVTFGGWSRHGLCRELNWLNSSIRAALTRGLPAIAVRSIRYLENALLPIVRGRNNIRPLRSTSEVKHCSRNRPIDVSPAVLPGPHTLVLAYSLGIEERGVFLVGTENVFAEPVLKKIHYANRQS